MPALAWSRQQWSRRDLDWGSRALGLCSEFPQALETRQPPVLGGKKAVGMQAVSCHLPWGAAIGHVLLTGTDRASSCLLEDLYKRAHVTKSTACQLKQGLSGYLLQFQYAEHLSDPLADLILAHSQEQTCIKMR